MSVKVHEAFSIDSFQDRLLWWDDFLGDQIQDEWRDGGSAGGSADVIDAQTGGIVRLTTDTDDGDSWLMDWADFRSLLVSKKVTIEFRLKLTQTPNTHCLLLIRFDVSNYIGFVYETAVSANWYHRCRDGGASTSQTTGIAADTSYHIFRVECFPTDEVHFYIDGVETANSPVTTNIPDDAGDFLQPFLYLQTVEDLAKSMDIDYVVVRQEI